MKIIVSDLDYTLLKDNMDVGKETSTYLNNLNNNEYMFVPCSSRSIDDLVNGIKDINTHYCVCSNGATIYNNKTKQVIDTKYLETNIAKEILTILKDIKFATTIVLNNIVYSDPILRDVYEYNNLDKDKIEKIFIHRTFNKDINNILDNNKLIEKLHLNFFNIEDQKEAMHRVLIHCNNNYYITNSSTLNLEITNIEANKGKAINRLCNILNINNPNIIAFGDNLNDKSLLGIANIKVAMNNAVDELKDVATVINPYTNDQEGVVKYLKDINF